jgi:hypothetical protein
MDPYMEETWGDVHNKLSAYAADALNGTLPSGLLARTEQRVYVEFGDGPPDERRPDVMVTERMPYESSSASSEAGGGTAMLVEPLRIHVQRDPRRERFIEIRDGNDAVITIIEFLSPTNKTDSRGFEEYHRKREQIYDSQTNLVEIDLTRAGGIAARARLWDNVYDVRMVATYGVCVFRARENTAEVHPIPLQARLPTIKVPLRREDDDVTLDLQPLIEQTWKNGRYEMTNYGRPLQPSMPEAEAAWAAERLDAWGTKGTSK